MEQSIMKRGYAADNKNTQIERLKKKYITPFLKSETLILGEFFLRWSADNDRYSTPDWRTQPYQCLKLRNSIFFINNGAKRLFT